MTIIIPDGKIEFTLRKRNFRNVWIVALKNCLSAPSLLPTSHATFFLDARGVYDLLLTGPCNLNCKALDAEEMAADSRERNELLASPLSRTTGQAQQISDIIMKLMSLKRFPLHLEKQRRM